VIMVARLPSSRGPAQLPDGARYQLFQWLHNIISIAIVTVTN